MKNLFDEALGLPLRPEGTLCVDKTHVFRNGDLMSG